MADVDFDCLTILLIDDDPFMLSLLEGAFSEFGTRDILTAENGEVGLRVVRTRRKIDLIICDLDMPTMDGFAFVRELRCDQDADVAATPVMILTGHSDEDRKSKALSLGIDGFLLKPVARDTLKSQVLAALRSPPSDPSKPGERGQRGSPEPRSDDRCGPTERGSRADS